MNSNDLWLICYTGMYRKYYRSHDWVRREEAESFPLEKAKKALRYVQRNYNGNEKTFVLERSAYSWVAKYRATGTYYANNAPLVGRLRDARHFEHISEIPAEFSASRWKPVLVRHVLRVRFVKKPKVVLPHHVAAGLSEWLDQLEKWRRLPGEAEMAISNLSRLGHKATVELLESLRKK